MSLSNDTYEIEEQLAIARKRVEGTIAADVVHVWRGLAELFNFDRFEELWTLVIECKLHKGGLDKLTPSILVLPNLYFWIALSGIELYRSSMCENNTKRRKRRQYLQVAKKNTKQIQQWQDNGNVNVGMQLEILLAGLEDIAGNYQQAEQHFGKAILLSGRRGFIYTQALAYEQRALYYIRKNNDRRGSRTTVGVSSSGSFNDAAQFDISQCLTLYREWCAYGKANHVQRKFESLLQKRSRTGKSGVNNGEQQTGSSVILLG